MTILSVDLTQQGTSLSGDGDGARQKRSYSANYIVKTDDPTTSAREIERHFKNTPALAWYGRGWKWTGENGNDSDPESICKKLSINHEPQSAGIFKVSAEYEPIDGDEKDKEKPSNSNDGEKSRDPLEWRDQISISYTQITEPVMLARFMGFTTGEDGNRPVQGIAALTNRIGKMMCPQASNLAPFDPLPEREIDLKIIRMTSNIGFFNSNLYDGWIGTVNNDPVNIHKQNLGVFVGIEPFTGRIKGVSASSDFQNGVAFVRREVEIWVNPKGWRGRLADMHMLTKPTESGEDEFVSPGDLINKPAKVEQTVPTDGKDYPVGTPILLDGFGRPLRSTNPHRTIWSNWIYYDERQWSGTVDKW